MTTPNIDTELYLPKTYLFERKDRGYSDIAYMTQLGSDLTYVYLPKGLCMVTVTATGMPTARAKLFINGPGGYSETLTDALSITDLTQRLWAGQISNPGKQSKGRWLKIQAWNVTTNAQNNGSVAVQIVNFPPEN